jgi:CheY-like chemotaxis protein
MTSGSYHFALRFDFSGRWRMSKLEKGGTTSLLAEAARMNTSTDVDLRRQGLDVLVVEDHGPSAASIEEFLRLSGHDVRVVADGRSALESLKTATPDVVLLDIALPGDMSGYDVAGWIGEQPTDKRPLLVAITGLDGEQDRRNSASAGIDLHLVKPVDACQLQGLLARFQRVVAL